MKHLARIVIVLGLIGLSLALQVPEALAQMTTPTPDLHGNANCLMCHSDPSFTGNLPGGETISLYVDPGQYYRSVHADAGLECLACHVGQKAYPHAASAQVSCSACHQSLEDVQNTAYRPLSVALDYPDARAVTLTFNESCRACHADKFEESVDSAHVRVQAGGNRYAPVCVDCHGSHDITPPDQPRARISQTCATCHLAVYSTYRASVHGAALEEESNPDVPTCVDCHGVHNVRGPRDPGFRNDMIAVCGGCHADEERMAKYGISTAVFQTYLEDFHGRTVNFFRRKADNIPSNKATCFDCHGIHNIRSPDDPHSTVYPENLQHTCQQCHADANITFPEAWLGHYIPTWEKTPLLYAVNVAYSYLVPITVGGFLLYIGLDARRRLAQRRRPEQKFIELEIEESPEELDHDED